LRPYFSRAVPGEPLFGKLWIGIPFMNSSLQIILNNRHPELIEIGPVLPKMLFRALIFTNY